MKYKFIFIVLLVLLAKSSESDQFIPAHPINDKNAHHWEVLNKVCEKRCPVNGKEVTYGANEYVDGKLGSCWQICQWKMVPYWPQDRK